MANPEELKPESVEPEAKRVSEKTSFVEGIDTDYVNAFPTILTHLGLIKEGQLLKFFSREDFIGTLSLPFPAYEEYIRTRPGYQVDPKEAEEIIARAKPERRAAVNAQIQVCDELRSNLLSILTGNFSSTTKELLGAKLVKTLFHEVQNLSLILYGKPMIPRKKEKNQEA